MNQAEQAIAALREKFLARLPSDRAAIERATGDPKHDGLRHLAHGLAGSAGIFCFPRLSRMAGSVDIALGANPPDAELADKVAKLIAEIDAVLSSQ